MKNKNDSENQTPNPTEVIGSLKAVKETFELYTSESFITPNKSKEEKKGESIKEFKPEVQSLIHEAKASAKKEIVDSLLNRDKELNKQIFETDDNALTKEQKSAIMKKIGKWESTKEINTANASVVANWMEKIGKIK